ncbi:MAG: tetratricopeptide repeat protein [Actinomycetota bacterium]|nr:tetratricopeptide repeat protein [Actinomycetota bacterium]
MRDLRQIQPPAGADPRALDADVRGALRPLGPAIADRVAAHLVAAGELLDRDPAAALEQARVARAFAARIGVVREAVGLAAYAAAAWAEALAELRAERRLTGSVTHLPVMADCERGLGRPQRALELAQSADVRDLDEPGRIEMLIVASGARRDLGQPAAAVVSLQAALGDRDHPQPWSARLWYAYADALLAAGRQAEAVEWFAAVAEIDYGDTDAEERLLTLEPNSPGP